jgi:two-component system, OmpR family, response regulator
MPGMYPNTLALIEDNLDFANLLAEYLKIQGVAVTLFSDSDDFLLAENAYGFDFYIVDLQLPGVNGLDVVRLLRRRVVAGIVVVTGQEGTEVVDAVLDAGADMYVLKPANFEQVGIAVRSVYRRNRRAAALSTTWRLEAKARTLTAPGGVCVPLGENDLAVMGCFVGAEGQAVSHALLCQRLGREATEETANWLHATIYRMRRRVEAAGAEPLPLSSQSRVGYVFRLPLTSV